MIDLVNSFNNLNVLNKIIVLISCVSTRNSQSKKNFNLRKPVHTIFFSYYCNSMPLHFKRTKLCICKNTLTYLANVSVTLISSCCKNGHLSFFVEWIDSSDGFPNFASFLYGRHLNTLFAHKTEMFKNKRINEVGVIIPGNIFVYMIKHIKLLNRKVYIFSISKQTFWITLYKSIFLCEEETSSPCAFNKQVSKSKALTTSE